MTTIASSKEAMARARVRMEKAVEDFRKELAGIRTGRAHVTLLDHIRVDYHGTSMPVNQTGTLSVPEPQRTHIRRENKEAVEKLEKEKKISEDERKRSVEELEKLTHSETKKIEDLCALKEKEILEEK